MQEWAMGRIEKVNQRVPTRKNNPRLQVGKSRPLNKEYQGHVFMVDMTDNNIFLFTHRQQARLCED